MEKRKHVVEKRFWPVRLYLDDIEKIISLLNESGFGKITIETAIGSYDSLELTKIEPGDLLMEISARNEFSLSIDFQYRKIRASEDSVTAVGLVQKIEELLTKRERNIVSFLKKTGFIYTVIFSCTILSTVSISKIGIRDTWIELAAYMICIMLSMLISGALIFIPFDTSITYLQKRKDVPNFWEKNKDQIILLILSTPISAALGAFATLLIVWK